jgi:hypothetical protein
MRDHDQRFKNLNREFFGDFLRPFFVDWVERFDCENVECLDTAVFPVRRTERGTFSTWSPNRRRDNRRPALIPRNRKPGWRWCTSRSSRRTRSHHCGHACSGITLFLRDKYSFPVLPIALYLKLGLDGIGVNVYEERFWELETVRFQYLYVGLPALEAVKYVQGDNWLGVALAALMKMPKEWIAEMGMEALRPSSRHRWGIRSGIFW